MYFLEFRTDKNIGSEDFVRKFLYDWYYHESELMRPEFYGMGDPVRYKIAERGIDSAVAMWLKNRMPVLLRRKSKPKFHVSMSWREDKGLDPRLFAWDCMMSMSFNAGDDLAIDMFKFVVTHLEPAFGSLSSHDDLKAKHYLEYEDERSLTQSYVGREPGGKTLPGDVSTMLPGVYWVTYFSRWAIDQVGEDKFANLDVYSLEEFQNGYLVRVYEKSKMILSEEALRLENAVIDKLGRDLFFDKSKLSADDIRALLK